MWPLSKVVQQRGFMLYFCACQPIVALQTVVEAVNINWARSYNGRAERPAQTGSRHGIHHVDYLLNTHFPTSIERCTGWVRHPLACSRFSCMRFPSVVVHYYWEPMVLRCGLRLQPCGNTDCENLAALFPSMSLSKRRGALT